MWSSALTRAGLSRAAWQQRQKQLVVEAKRLRDLNHSNKHHNKPTDRIRNSNDRRTLQCQKMESRLKLSAHPLRSIFHQHPTSLVLASKRSVHSHCRQPTDSHYILFLSDIRKLGAVSYKSKALLIISSSMHQSVTRRDV